MICGCSTAGGDYFQLQVRFEDSHWLFRIHFNATDIFTYFAEQAQLKTLPSFEELEIAAKKLFETYVSAGARYQVQLDARDEAASWATQAPLGAPWQGPPASTTPAAKKGRRKPVKLAKVGATTAKKPAKKKTAEPPKLPFYGDQVFFDNGTFMHDAMISREVAAAVAQGAVGRVWEALKVNLRRWKSREEIYFLIGNGLHLRRIVAPQVYGLSLGDDLRPGTRIEPILEGRQFAVYGAQSRRLCGRVQGWGYFPGIPQPLH